MRAIVSRLTTVRLEYVAAGVLLYVAGQALSTWKWRLLLGARRPGRGALPAAARVLLHRHVLQSVPADHGRRRCREGRAPGARNGRAGARHDVRVHGAEPRAVRAAVDRARRELARAGCRHHGRDAVDPHAAAVLRASSRPMWCWPRAACTGWSTGSSRPHRWRACATVRRRSTMPCPPTGRARGSSPAPCCCRSCSRASLLPWYS